ncbi:unnamed protein product [Nyctereutes procyonoides]|uniref:(raccoon dog) hypothetical protein n=1 Tax=Nyctereutes procyonoides TaxID=34880 RepID=A0A811ZEE7_NYCPR|nr:unnamed protein product [Nyctereutes procyonoides]
MRSYWSLLDRRVKGPSHTSKEILWPLFREYKLEGVSGSCETKQGANAVVWPEENEYFMSTYIFILIRFLELFSKNVPPSPPFLLLPPQHPLEESRDCLAFCTEPIFASLANVLGNWENLPSSVPLDVKDYNLYDVETKYGLLQVSEGLSFLHSSVKMVHGNITPENIILNKSEMGPKFTIMCVPNCEYLGPEYMLPVSCERASDMYSLGTVKYAVFNKGKPIFEVNKHDIYKSFRSSSPSNRHEEVQEHIKLDVGAITLQYFETSFQRDNLQRSQFFKGLEFVPCLTSELVTPAMVSFVLLTVLLIAKEGSKEAHVKLSLPERGSVFKQQEPIQELCLNIIPSFASLIDYASMKNSLIPRIKNACLQTSSLAEPAVLMGILGTYKCTFTHKKLGITKEQCIENNLNLHQFNSFISVIKETLNRLETEHKTKLEQLHIMQEQQKSASLTLEEKQKLTKEQGQAQKLRSRQPLKPQVHTPVAPVKQTKDLTDTSKHTWVIRTTLGAPSTLPNFSAVLSVPPAGAKPTQQRPTDMPTLFFFFFTKPKVSMNQLSQQKPNQWLNQFVAPQGPPGIGSSVMGTQINVRGWSASGVQANPFINPQNFAQPPINMTSSNSASNDFKDLSG